LRPGRLQTDFELSSKHPRLPTPAIDHERLASMGDLKERSAAAQLHMSLAIGEMHGDGAIGIERHLRLIDQRHRAHLPGADT
jgi:hypothetical protein